MAFQPLFHALERGFVGVPREVALPGLPTLRLQWAIGAVLGVRRIDPAASIELFELQRLAAGALIAIALLVVGEGAGLRVLAGLELLAIGVARIWTPPLAQVAR